MQPLLVPLAVALAAQTSGAWERTETGLVVTPAQGPEAEVRLAVYGDRIVRVTTLPTRDARPEQSLMVTAAPVTQGFTVRAEGGRAILSTSRLVAEVDLADGNVRFRDADGRDLLAESAPAAFAPVTVEGQSYVSVRQQWNRGSDEGLYGLGQHQNGQMNYNGEDVELAQHNVAIVLPFLLSTRNYGILWDNNSISRFGAPERYALVGSDAGLAVTGADGTPGWTATYTLAGREPVRRSEPSIDYQYLDDRPRWPTSLRAANGDPENATRVVWSGRVTASQGGRHRFRLYGSSYVKLRVNGRLVVDRWRQNWNPWYYNFTLDLPPGRASDISVEWESNGGYVALLYSPPEPEADRHSIRFASEVARAADYYVVAGDDAEGVIAGYRQLTGRSTMLPRWASGFWQSRQRYETQAQLVGVVEEYRRRNLPLDAIVQDWFYWPEAEWGSHRFDAARFPDPQAMIDRVHALNARFMISVWPKFYPTTDNYRELSLLDAVYRRNLESGDRDWVGPGYLSTFYDAYNPAGRAIYFRQIRDRLGVLGVDAWWLDATEPDMHSNLSLEERARRQGPTARGPGAALFNPYALPHAEGLNDNLIAWHPDVRPFILTRSGFGGIQRTGAAVWSGDVAARWDDLREQIAAGINYSLSGAPNWTHDIGGFAVEARYSSQDPAHVEEWRELNTRWFQFGAFSPLFRSHGELPRREIYELAPEGSPTYETLAAYDRLRYRLMPYIYTLAADTWHRDGTIMRGLVMDFASDRRVRDVADQYMFGPSLLVAPVTRFRARTRDVYLPAGVSWYDLRTGRAARGGRTVRADAPYEWMPLYARAGSIIPTGPMIQHSGEGQNGPLTLHVFTGVNGAFSLYEDDGTSRQYLRGAFARIPIRWDQATQALHLGARAGHYPGMAERREIRVLWYSEATAHPFDPDGRADVTLIYDGRARIIPRAAR
jgi:alpha-D-xyloside xylohydrolase